MQPGVGTWRMKKCLLEPLIFVMMSVNYMVFGKLFLKASNLLVRAMKPLKMQSMIVWLSFISLRTLMESYKNFSPFLYDDLHGLLEDIVSKFVKSKVLAECKTLKNLVETKSYLTCLVVTKFRMMKSKSSEKSVSCFLYSQLFSLSKLSHQSSLILKLGVQGRLNTDLVFDVTSCIWLAKSFLFYLSSLGLSFSGNMALLWVEQLYFCCNFLWEHLT